MSLRLEKSYGTWFREYRPIYTPLEGGITRYIKLDHEFIGRAAHEAELAAGGPARRLVAFVVEPDPDDPADVIGDEPIWHDGAVVGWVTSGGYGHHVKAVDRAGLRADRPGDAGRPRRRRVRDRDHRPAPAGPAPAASRCSTRRASGCASDRAAGAAGRGARGRIVVDGRPVAVRAGRLGRGRDPARRRGRRAAAGRCASPATAATASPRSTASPTSGRARSPARPGLARRPASGGANAAAPRRAAAGPRRDAARARRSRSSGSRSTSRSSAAGRAGSAAAADARAAGRTVRRPRRRRPATRSSAIYAGPDGRRPDARAGCSTSTPTRSSSRPAPPRSTRSARATTWPGSSRPAPPSALHAAGVDLGRAVAIGTPPAGVPCDALDGRLVRFEGDATAASAPS